MLSWLPCTIEQPPRKLKIIIEAKENIMPILLTFLLNYHTPKFNYHPLPTYSPQCWPASSQPLKFNTAFYCSIITTFVPFFRNKFQRLFLWHRSILPFCQNPFISKISKSILLTVYIHFLNNVNSKSFTAWVEQIFQSWKMSEWNYRTFLVRMHTNPVSTSFK